jgi:hypothetical protein
MVLGGSLQGDRHPQPEGAGGAGRPVQPGRHGFLRRGQEHQERTRLSSLPRQDQDHPGQHGHGPGSDQAVRRAAHDPVQERGHLALRHGRSAGGPAPVHEILRGQPRARHRLLGQRGGRRPFGRLLRGQGRGRGGRPGPQPGGHGQPDQGPAPVQQERAGRHHRAHIRHRQAAPLPVREPALAQHPRQEGGRAAGPNHLRGHPPGHRGQEHHRPGPSGKDVRSTARCATPAPTEWSSRCTTRFPR